MLDPADRARVAAVFGADDAQIRRDHLISHLLAALATLVGDDVVFFGGTALARTHLPAGRLSEDIDLYTGERRRVAEELTQRWPQSVRREYPRLVWDPDLAAGRDVEPARLVADDGAAVRVQLLAAEGTYSRWPTECREIEPRYRDVAPLELRVPTLTAFTAMKAAAWRERRAARDLFDLAALAGVDAIDADAVALVRGVTGTPLVPADLRRPPTDWQTQLGHQTRLDLDAETALRTVREAWGRAAAW